MRERDRVIATTQAARAKQEAEARERSQYLTSYSKSLDHAAGGRCNFSVDPTHPNITHEQDFSLHADWGKVLRREQIRLQPKNALDQGELATMVEVEGHRRHYKIHVERLARGWPFVVNVGDLALVCEPLRPDARPYWEKRRPDPAYPAEWSDIQHSGFVARIARPPLVASKARWNAIHVSPTTLFWAVRKVRWPYPPDRFVLAHAQVERALGRAAGRWWATRRPTGSSRCPRRSSTRSSWSPRTTSG